MTTCLLQSCRGVLRTLAACLLATSTVYAVAADKAGCDLYAPATDAVGPCERSQGNLYSPTVDTEAPAADWRAELYAPKEDATVLARSSQDVWKGDLYAPVEHTTDPAEASASGSKADLYAPIHDACGPTGGRSSSESLSDGNGLALYQPVEQLPRADCVGGLYLVSASATAPTGLGLRQAGLSARPTTPLYAPSLGSSDSPLMASVDHAGLADGNMWDTGIAMPGVRGRQLGMIRGAVYSGDVDTLTLLYDLAPAVEAKLEPDPAMEPPRELSKVSLPIYRVKPPDTLQIMAVKLVPRPPYYISTYDVLQINVGGTLRGQPINSYYLVEAEGVVSLGAAYGPVRVVGMTIEQAKAEITQHLQTILQRPAVTVQLARSEGMQQIMGMYQIGPDGTVNLGGCGSVYVSGKTIAEVRVAVEQQLARFFDGPQVTVDVVGYHSESYYVITAGASIGESVQRFGMTGNETVLDAISQTQGLSRISSKTMWVARATPGGMMCNEILPVDWVAITRGARTDTNYQILPGDRIYIVDDKLVTGDSLIARFTNPIQQALNITLLGGSTIRNTQVLGRSYNQFRR